MNGFLVRFSKTESALEHMQQVESEIHSEEEEVSRIRRGFRHQFGGKERILQNLKAQMDKMAQMGDDALTFQTTLSSIMELYTAAEENLLKNIEIPAQQTNASSSLPGGAVPDEESSAGRSPVADAIHEAGKRDEDRGLAPGVSFVAASVAGSAVLGAARYGNPTGDLMEAPAAGTEEDAPAGEQAVTGGGTQVECADMDSITSAVPGFSEDFLNKLATVASWEEFLELFPEDTIDQLPEAGINYLKQLFEQFNTGHFIMGDAVFPEIPELLTCGVWGTFFTAIMWYFYLNGNEEAAGALVEPINTEDGTSTGENPLEGKVIDLPEGGSELKGKDELRIKSGKNPQKTTDPGEKGKDPGTDASGDGSKTADSSGKGKNAGGSSGGSGSGGHRSSGGSGGGSSGAGSSMPEYHSSIQDDPSAGARAGAGEGPQAAASDKAAGADTDATGEYLRSLLGGDGTSVSEGLKSWTKSNMTNWGTQAANKLHNGSASFSDPGPVSTVARSVVRAAVVDAGLGLAAHGAGAVSAAAESGNKDIFEEMD